jgi:hypothetical protein
MTNERLPEPLGTIQDAGIKINEVGLLPDGSGFAVGSLPLPKDHWLTKESEYHEKYKFNFDTPPMPFRMGKNVPARKFYEQALQEAGRYALRAATENGKIDDYDPDAVIKNLIVGFLGYFTDDGLSEDEWANPKYARKNDEQ